MKSCFSGFSFFNDENEAMVKKRQLSNLHLVSYETFFLVFLFEPVFS